MRFMTLAFLLSLALSWQANFKPLPDTASPLISWEVTQPGILAVTADDADSMPARMEVSLDDGQTWQVMDFPVSWAQPAIRVPSVTWNLELAPGLNRIQVRAIDGAGNASQVIASVQND